MSNKHLTRRDFIKTTSVGLAGAGLLCQYPGLAGLAMAGKNYTFGSASATGSWYPLAVAMSKMINDNVPGYNVTGVTTPGASRENILRIDRKEMELAWSSANILYKGYEGLKPFKAKKRCRAGSLPIRACSPLRSDGEQALRALPILKARQLPLALPAPKP